MAACGKCGARNPEKNGHHFGCGTLGKKADPSRNKKKEKKK